MPSWVNFATDKASVLPERFSDQRGQTANPCSEVFGQNKPGRPRRVLGARTKGKHNGEKALARVLTPEASEHKLFGWDK